MKSLWYLVKIKYNKDYGCKIGMDFCIVNVDSPNEIFDEAKKELVDVNFSQLVDLEITKL